MFSDASFASDADMTSQLGYVTKLVDAPGKANVLHYSSVKSKPVTRCVLSAKMFAARNAFVYARTLRETLNEIFDFGFPCVYTRTKILFRQRGVSDLNHRKPSFDRLISNLSKLKLCEISEVVWISSVRNPADAMKKQNDSGELKTPLKNK